MHSVQLRARAQRSWRQQRQFSLQPVQQWILDVERRHSIARMHFQLEFLGTFIFLVEKDCHLRVPCSLTSSVVIL